MQRDSQIAIGLPVYNGERYLALALESFLAQTFGDFEIVISDNGSTDATADIGRAFAARDPRIRYIRQDENRGAAWNFNFVFQQTTGQYFKWAACDDLHAPDFLRQCKVALDEDRAAVLAFSGTEFIDEGGRVAPPKERMATFASLRPYERFREAAGTDHACFDIFGLIRRDILARTPGLGTFASADRVLLTELSLHGHFIELPEKLFLRRDHADTSTRQYRDVYCRSAWFDPAKAGQVTFPTWRLLSEYCAAIGRSPLKFASRLSCRLQLFSWLWHKKRHLLADLRVFLHSLFTGDRSIYTAGRAT